MVLPMGKTLHLFGGILTLTLTLHLFGGMLDPDHESADS